MSVLGQEEPDLTVDEVFEKLMGLLRSIPMDWCDLGLGTVRDQVPSSTTGAALNNRVFYKVIEWRAWHAFRHSFMLPDRDLHITVGFEHSDMHHVRKDTRTLLHRNPPPDSHREWWPAQHGLQHDVLQLRLAEVRQQLEMLELTQEEASHELSSRISDV